MLRKDSVVLRRLEGGRVWALWRGLSSVSCFYVIDFNNSFLCFVSAEKPSFSGLSITYSPGYGGGRVLPSLRNQ